MKLAAPFVVLFGLLAAAVLWDDTPSSADLVFVNRGDVFTLDPQRMSYMQDFTMAYALYEGLVRWNNRDLTIEPAAADLPALSDDQLTYTFRVRPEAKWSNGDPVTAHDFVYAWQRLLWPDTAADYSNLLFAVDGAEEFFAWRSEQLAAFAAGRQPQAATQGSAPDHSPAHLAFALAQRQFEATVGIKAVDDQTLRIKLRRPTPYFLDLLCFAVCLPVHRPTVEGWPEEVAWSAAMRERGWVGVTRPAWSQRRFLSINPLTGRLEQKHEWARPGRLIGNGPYVLSQWRYKRDLRLDRNPLFHNQRIVRNDSVLLLSIEDANTSVLAFESGKIDWNSDVGAEYQSDMLQQRRRYEDRHRAALDAMLSEGRTIDEALARLPSPEPGERRDVHPYPTFGVDFFNFNCRPALADGWPNPFADPAVRRAFCMSIDKRTIVQAATRLDEPVMNALILPGSIPGYQSPAGLAYDLQRARQELAAAGWRDRNNDGLIEDEAGRPFPTIDLLWTTNSSRYKWISLELKSQWERELGVRVQLRSADTKFYKEDLKLGKFMIARGRWYGDYGDPTTFLDINRTGDGNNDRGFTDPAFDSMLERASTERDPKKRLRLLEEAERYLMEEQAPLLPICQLVQLYMYEPGRLTGLTEHPRLIQYLWQIEVKR